jgi:hypothetical protein
MTMAREFSAGSRSASPLEQESAATLVSRLVSDATALVRNELALAKAEFGQTASAMKTGMIALAIGAAVLLAGLLALLACAILALAEIVEPWLAALIVGAALALLGLVLVQGAKKKFQPSELELDRTQTSLQKDAEVIARRT